MSLSLNAILQLQLPDGFSCGICREGFLPTKERPCPENAYITPCGHEFHLNCILLAYRANSTCSVCRAALSYETFTKLHLLTLIQSMLAEEAIRSVQKRTLTYWRQQKLEEEADTLLKCGICDKSYLEPEDDGSYKSVCMAPCGDDFHEQCLLNVKNCPKKSCTPLVREWRNTPVKVPLLSSLLESMRKYATLNRVYNEILQKIRGLTANKPFRPTMLHHEFVFMEKAERDSLTNALEKEGFKVIWFSNTFIRVEWQYAVLGKALERRTEHEKSSADVTQKIRAVKSFRLIERRYQNPSNPLSAPKEGTLHKSLVKDFIKPCKSEGELNDLIENISNDYVLATSIHETIIQNIAPMEEELDFDRRLTTSLIDKLEDALLGFEVNDYGCDLFVEEDQLKREQAFNNWWQLYGNYFNENTFKTMDEYSLFWLVSIFIRYECSGATSAIIEAMPEQAQKYAEFLAKNEETKLCYVCNRAKKQFDEGWVHAIAHYVTNKRIVLSELNAALGVDHESPHKPSKGLLEILPYLRYIRLEQRKGKRKLTSVQQGVFIGTDLLKNADRLAFLEMWGIDNDELALSSKLKGLFIMHNPSLKDIPVHANYRWLCLLQCKSVKTIPNFLPRCRVLDLRGSPQVSSSFCYVPSCEYLHSSAGPSRCERLFTNPATVINSGPFRHDLLWLVQSLEDKLAATAKCYSDLIDPLKSDTTAILESLIPSKVQLDILSSMSVDDLFYCIAFLARYLSFDKHLHSESVLYKALPEVGQKFVDFLRQIESDFEHRWQASGEIIPDFIPSYRWEEVKASFGKDANSVLAHVISNYEIPLKRVFYMFHIEETGFFPFLHYADFTGVNKNLSTDSLLVLCRRAKYINLRKAEISRLPPLPGCEWLDTRDCKNLRGVNYNSHVHQPTDERLLFSDNARLLKNTLRLCRLTARDMFMSSITARVDQSTSAPLQKSLQDQGFDVIANYCTFSLGYILEISWANAEDKAAGLCHKLMLSSFKIFLNGFLDRCFSNSESTAFPSTYSLTFDVQHKTTTANEANAIASAQKNTLVVNSKRKFKRVINLLVPALENEGFEVTQTGTSYSISWLTATRGRAYRMLLSDDKIVRTNVISQIDDEAAQRGLFHVLVGPFLNDVAIRLQATLKEKGFTAVQEHEKLLVYWAKPVGSAAEFYIKAEKTHSVISMRVEEELKLIHDEVLDCSSKGKLCYRHAYKQEPHSAIIYERIKSRLIEQMFECTVSGEQLVISWAKAASGLAAQRRETARDFCMQKVADFFNRQDERKDKYYVELAPVFEELCDVVDEYDLNARSLVTIAGDMGFAVNPSVSYSQWHWEEATEGLAATWKALTDSICFENAKAQITATCLAIDLENCEYTQTLNFDFLFPLSVDSLLQEWLKENKYEIILRDFLSEQGQFIYTIKVTEITLAALYDQIPSSSDAILQRLKAKVLFAIDRAAGKGDTHIIYPMLCARYWASALRSVLKGFLVTGQAPTRDQPTHLSINWDKPRGGYAEEVAQKAHKVRAMRDIARIDYPGLF